MHLEFDLLIAESQEQFTVSVGCERTTHLDEYYALQLDIYVNFRILYEILDFYWEKNNNKKRILFQFN